MNEYERIVAAYDADPKCRNYDFSVARARIAELEQMAALYGTRYEEETDRADKAEAKLAELRERRCETCYFNDICDAMLSFDVDNPTDVKKLTFCSSWQARQDGES